MLIVHLQLANANYDAVGAFEQLLPSTAAPNCTTRAYTFEDADHLEDQIVPAVVKLLQMEEYKDIPLLLFFHTHIITDKRTKNQGDFVLGMDERSPKIDPRAAATRKDGHEHRCSVCNASGKLLLCHGGGTGRQCSKCAHLKCAEGLALALPETAYAANRPDLEDWHCPACAGKAASGKRTGAGSAATVAGKGRGRQHQREYPAEIFECASAYTPRDVLQTLFEPIAAAIHRRSTGSSSSSIVFFNNCSVLEYPVTSSAFTALSKRVGSCNSVLTFGTGVARPGLTIPFLAEFVSP